MTTSGLEMAIWPPLACLALTLTGKLAGPLPLNLKLNLSHVPHERALSEPGMESYIWVYRLIYRPTYTGCPLSIRAYPCQGCTSCTSLSMPRMHLLHKPVHAKDAPPTQAYPCQGSVKQVPCVPVGLLADSEYMATITHARDASPMAQEGNAPAGQSFPPAACARRRSPEISARATW